MVKPKKIPMRQCLGCREHFPKKELIRVVRAPASAEEDTAEDAGACIADSRISLDARGKKPGRGAYLCPKKECLAKARRSRALERMLECTISDALYDEMAAQVETLTPEGEE